MAKKLLLGIDVGTSGTKTALFEPDGRLVASHTADYTLYRPENGYAEQEPDDWYKAVCEGTRAVLARSGANPEDIAGVGLSGQMHGLVMLDKNGEVLRRAILWCDVRTGAECAEIVERVGKKRLVEITANPALTAFTASKLLWVRKHEPEKYASCRHMLMPKDYIRYRLTGLYGAEVSDASGTQLLDTKSREWSSEMVSKLGLDGDILPPVHESPEVAGYVTAEAAELTGLKAGTPVVYGAGDNAAAAVGIGVVRDGEGFTTIGTSGVVYAHTSKVSIDSLGRAQTFCCSVPGAWSVLGTTQAAGLSLKWFRENFCLAEELRAQKVGADVYAVMDSEAAKSPIGANRLLFLPYLMGERTPHVDPSCRGVFFGLSASHTRADAIRAVLEGVSYSLAEALGVLKDMGVSPSSMLVCGGGAKSALWRQMLADIYGCGVCAAGGEGAALGAALLAGVGAGVYPSVEKAAKAAVTPPRTQEPIAGNSEKYRGYFEMYRSLYPALKERFAALAAV